MNELLKTEGKELIKSFIDLNDTICSMTSAYSDEKCSFSLVCLEQILLIT